MIPCEWSVPSRGFVVKEECNSKSEELVRGEETQIYIRVNREKEVTFLPGGVKSYVFPVVVSSPKKVYKKTAAGITSMFAG